MADVTINYKGSKIAELNVDGTKTLKTSGTYCEGDIAVNYIKPGSGVPSGAHIKYMIPCTFTAPRTADGLGFDGITFTFTRENVNQFFFVNWELQDETDYTTPGYWIQHLMWVMCKQGNSSSTHCVSNIFCGHGKAGNSAAAASVQMYPMTALTATISFGKNVGSSSSYARLGQNYKGLLIITDENYDGLPIVDSTKLSDFLAYNYVVAGW